MWHLNLYFWTAKIAAINQWQNQWYTAAAPRNFVWRVIGFNSGSRVASKIMLLAKPRSIKECVAGRARGRAVSQSLLLHSKPRDWIILVSVVFGALTLAERTEPQVSVMHWHPHISIKPLLSATKALVFLRFETLHIDKVRLFCLPSRTVNLFNVMISHYWPKRPWRLQELEATRISRQWAYKD
jgi:hypothetical protein